MAAGELATRAQAEVTCSICLEGFKEPVTTDCGHSFCQDCISQYWGQLESNFCCPQCGETCPQGNLRPSKELRNMVGSVRDLSSQVAHEPEGERVCDRHQEALKLFCEEDQMPICLVCRESRAHRTHPVLPMEEAAQEYKDQIQSHLQRLRKERWELLGFQSAEEKASEKLMRQVELERQRVTSECEQLRQLLAKEEGLRLAQLGELDSMITRRKKESVTRLGEEISRLSALIVELEGKCQQPAPEFLQGVRSTVSRAEKVTSQHLMLISQKLGRRSWAFPRGSRLLTALGGFVGSFSLQVLPWTRNKCAVLAVCIALAVCLLKIHGTYPAKFANVVLDQDTANPKLILSEDGKVVRMGDYAQRLVRNPNRFDLEPCVLGMEGFNSGRHFWVVELTGRSGWAVGVARQSVLRKSSLSLHPEEGLWAVHEQFNGFKARTSPENTVLLEGSPARIRIYLDYEAGLVAFYDAENEVPIFNFTASFATEKIFPFFGVWGSRVQIKLAPPDAK
nr:E3 ubiquitin-protein ligase TRIM39-like isoform X1 [Pelodiscus sinensis]|eukprot:XP_006114652.1 E3 ubiquitin-protein ligase TRIM39-like isoform X1 [Pelodiscus sinensis]